MKILLVDDEQLILEGLQILLEQEAFQVVATASSGKEALQRYQETPAEVVLMDLRMPESDGIEGTRLLKAHDPEVKILILTTFRDLDYIERAMAAGASGYLLKDSSTKDIARAIKSVKEGQVIFHPEVSQVLLQKDQEDALTERERELVLAVARGLSNQEIAEEFHLSLGTVKNYISGILQKLDLRDRTSLAIYAYKNKWI